MSAVTLSDTGFTEAEVVHTFMQEVDVVTAVRKLDSVGDYLELLELFYADGERKLELLPQLLEQPEDLGRYVIEVHGLKSAAANIGADVLSARAKEHEMAGKDGKADWVRGNLQPLTDNYQAVLAEIRRALTGWQFGRFAAADEAQLTPLADGERAERLQKALGFLEDFESKQALHEVESLLGCVLPDEVRAGLEKARSLLKSYADDEAEDVLRGLTE